MLTLKINKKVNYFYGAGDQDELLDVLEHIEELNNYNVKNTEKRNFYEKRLVLWTGKIKKKK